MTLELLLGLASFTITLLLHALIWNLFKVRKEIVALLAVFILVPMAGYIGAGMAGLVPFWSSIAAGLLHFMLACAYIQTYPALREDIPSIRILLMINANPAIHTSYIVRHFQTEGRLSDQKIEDLWRDGLIVRPALPTGHLTLTRAGILLAAFFYFYRKILGVQREQG